MPSLREQLRAYAEVLDESSTPSTAQEAMSRPRSTADQLALDPLATRPSDRRARWVGVAAAMLALAALVGGLVWLAEDRGERDDEVATSSREGGSLVDPEAWEHVPDAFEAIGPAVVGSDGEQLLALAPIPCLRSCPGDDRTHTSSLRSVDGRSWEQVSEFAGDGRQFSDLQHGDTTWMALESSGDGSPTFPYSVDLAYFPEGRILDYSFLAAEAQGTGLAVRGSRIVVSGVLRGTRPVVWTGTDPTAPLKLIDLGPVPNAQGVTALTTVPPVTGIDGFTELTAVTATADGFLVAADGPSREPALLESPDGVTWTFAPGEPPPGRVRELLSTEGGVVALIGEDETAPWRFDGSAWAPMGEALPLAGPSELATSGEAIVAVVGEADGPSRIGASVDGRSWEWFPAGFVPDGSGPLSVTAHQDGFVVVGEGDVWLWYPDDAPSATLQPLPSRPEVDELSWDEIAYDPVEVGWDLAEWTGEQFFVVRFRDVATGDLGNPSGEVWDRSSGDWVAIADPPLTPRGVPVHTWTGDELLVWGGERDRDVGEVPLDPTDRDGPDPERFGDGAAYDPEEDEWRELPASPLPPGGSYGYASAWTGDEWILWGGPRGMRPWDDPDLTAAGFDGRFGLLSQQGAAYDPDEDEWRELPPAPVDLLNVQGAWNGDEFLIWGSPYDPEPGLASDGIVVVAYDPADDEWRELPDVDINGPTAGVLTDAGFILVGDPKPFLWDDDEWRPIDAPGVFDCSEDPTSLVPFDGTALVVASCSPDAYLLDLDSMRWSLITNTPADPAPAYGRDGLDSVIVHAGRWDESALWLVTR